MIFIDFLFQMILFAQVCRGNIESNCVAFKNLKYNVYCLILFTLQRKSKIDDQNQTKGKKKIEKFDVSENFLFLLYVQALWGQSIVKCYTVLCCNISDAIKASKTGIIHYILVIILNETKKKSQELFFILAEKRAL